METKAEDFDLESLGFLVIWLDTSGEVISSQSTTKSKDVVTIGGTDVWWPWWAWLIYAGVVVCCICPMLFFFFKWRRDKEAEEEGFGAPGDEIKNASNSKRRGEIKLLIFYHCCYLDGLSVCLWCWIEKSGAFSRNQGNAT